MLLGNTKEEKLFELAKPYLEKNDFGVTHTQRVFNIAKKNFTINDESKEEIYALIILHDIGGSSIKEQYERGPLIASELMKQLGYPDSIIVNVCEMIKHHHEKLDDASEPFKILYDSDQIVKFSEEEFHYYSSRKIDLDPLIDSMYYDNSKILAKKMLSLRTMRE